MDTTWLDESPFLRDLGVRWHDGEVVMTVTEPHTAHGALHGGATAALALAAAQATMRAEDPETDPSTTSLHVTYARSGRGSRFTAASTTLRRARELGFHQTEIRDEAGQVIAGASSTLADGRQGTGVAPDAPVPPGDPAVFTKAAEAIPFLRGRKLRFEGVGPGELELSMGLAERNLDAKGRFDEGALVTLIDMAGTSVPWTLARSGNGGATISLHAQFLGPAPAEPVTARATVRAHDERVFWTDITVFTTADRKIHALSQLAYRFA
ncbi:hotdog fold thioesterase [Amycolatopsis xylanica]|uniref:hotdog fold thioesterase n=1 Tax=Amycolatopsis xylanica TaxID=589385 RepID=UPI0015A0A22D|nr:hotdog fold thioesterase [Amycolatopsis xylanica]